MKLEHFWKHFAEEFYNCLAQKCENESRNWLYYYDSNPIFTQLIQDTMRLIGKKLGYSYNNILFEHHRIDYSFGKNDKNGDFLIEYAIEHENNYLTWCHELNQLRKIPKDIIKVLISFYRMKDQSIEHVQREIRNIVENINELSNNFLFIFGPGCRYGDDINELTIKANDYRAFVVRNNQFVDLEDIKIFRRFPTINQL